MSQHLSSAHLEPERLHTILALIGRYPKLRQAVMYDQSFWFWSNTLLRLEQNVTGSIFILRMGMR